MKLKQADLWKHVKKVVLPVAGVGDEPGTGPEDVGKFDFIAKDPARLQADLRARSDFADPGTGVLGWDSRQDVDDCSLHIAHFGTNPSRVNAHVDKSGLSWNPTTWLPHLFLDAIGDGYQDVGDLNRLLRQRGLDWTQPISPQPPQSTRRFQIQSFQRIVAGAGGRVAAPGSRSRVGRGQFRWQARELPGADRPEEGTTFPSLRLIGSPAQFPRARPFRIGRLSGTTLPAGPSGYEFSVRELPGLVRTGQGGRLEFPGVQVTAQPRPNLLDELGDHFERTTNQLDRRFDWSVRPMPVPLSTQLPLEHGRFGLELTAKPRPNLLRELGEHLREPPARYRFSVRQQPGLPQRQPGGGIEFPPMHMVARPADRGFLAQLGGRLGGPPRSPFAR
jgi:hypothetical protein